MGGWTPLVGYFLFIDVDYVDDDAMIIFLMYGILYLYCMSYDVI